jgi:ferredoxin
MNIEKWIIAHFSPTGGTKKIADAIAAGFNIPVVEMDLTKADSVVTLGEKDALMAVLPVYAGRVPQISLEQLSSLKGNGQKAVAVVVYGNREYEDALLETKDALEANGFPVIAAAAFIAEHSIVRTIAAGRPDAEDEALCRQFAADVMAKADDAASVQVPGNNPYKELKPSAFHPAASESCVQCGVCAQQCPVGAIPLDDPSQTNHDLCINCMRCVEACPQQCRALPDAFLNMITQMLNQNAARYKKSVVFL